ncbi:MAG TPA: hypothetical protein VF072_16710 [Thermoleophilaceae bacterium]
MTCPEEEWSPEQRASYERECVREARDQLTRVLRSPREQRELKSVRLQGGYPETAIVVALWDGRFEKDVERSYPIWALEVFKGYRGVREPPNQVGMLITTWALGG